MSSQRHSIPARLAALAYAIAVAHAVRTLTIRNQCTQSVWPVIYTRVGQALSMNTGWEAPPGSSLALQVPDDSWGGRIWARTKCNFDDPDLSGVSTCETGGCTQGLICEEDFSGTPATLVEITMTSQSDYYDISVVDGYSIGARIVPDADKCPTVECLGNSIISNCPAEIQIKSPTSGNTVACVSSCQADIDGNQGNSTNCCTGAFALPTTCPPGDVKFRDFFKKQCPNTYTFPYDESDTTHQVLYNCTEAKGYTILFCPGDGGSSGSTTAAPSTDLADSLHLTGSSTSSTTSSPSSLPLDGGEDGPPVAAIAGGTVAGLAALAAVGVLAFFLWRRKRQPRSNLTLLSANRSVYNESDTSASVSPFTRHIEPRAGARGGSGAGYAGGVSGVHGSEPNLNMRTANGAGGPVMLIGGGGKRSQVQRQASGETFADQDTDVPPLPTGKYAPATLTRRADGTGTDHRVVEPASAQRTTSTRRRTHSGPEQSSSSGRVPIGPTSPPGRVSSYEAWSASGEGSSVMIIGPATTTDSNTDDSTRAVAPARRPRPESNATSNPHKDFPPPAYSSINYNGSAE